ncbi:DNA-directed RNA polymerase V subunit 5A [Medicago truncatula]|uniref:RNA polymerase Rpb5, amino-terminal domain protein n=1 Tax=Medicago truncatula TaxID=3880 RepID=A0A072UW34_MEDTR|nr:DNA-directed RNA polymerase V subunit 5A [Medicago truncatula]KEH34034.1 RNA polymerase Rpb5, amino-terminal domain protein [Medicago truncatula]
MAMNENGNETRSECLVRMCNEESDIETIHYFECRKTLMEMLHDRGYNVSESDLTLFLSIVNVSVNFLNLKPLVFVFLFSLTPLSRNGKLSIKLNDLLVNVTKHVLQPKYEVLTANEKQNLLKYKVEEKQLPHMLRTDAIASYYGLEKGQVVKISHSGEMFNS